MNLLVYTVYLFGVKNIKNNYKNDDNNAFKQRYSMNCVSFGRGKGHHWFHSSTESFFTFNRTRKPAGGPDSCPRWQTEAQADVRIYNLLWMLNFGVFMTIWYEQCMGKSVSNRICTVTDVKSCLLNKLCILTVCSWIGQVSVHFPPGYYKKSHRTGHVL